jgi:hypothetical protein
MLWVTLLLLSAFGFAQGGHVVVSGSAPADSPAVLYPGWGTTLNGNAVYYSVIVRIGDRVQTTTETAKIWADDLELEIAPHTLVFFGEKLILDCGSVVVRSGTATVTDGTTTGTFTVGESVHSISTFCGDFLPNAPSAVLSARQLGWNRSSDPAPAATPGILNVDFSVANWSYWTATGTMLGSSFAAANLTQNCLHAGACNFVPRAFRSSSAMYRAGLPTAAAVAYLTYYLKRKGYAWWFVPEAIVTVGNIAVSTHAAHYSH